MWLSKLFIGMSSVQTIDTVLVVSNRNAEEYEQRQRGSGQCRGRGTTSLSLNGFLWPVRLAIVGNTY